jgi:hypothetical protein
MMGADSRSQTGFADYLDLLRVFDEREAEALIVGGQAVNFWAEVFEEEEPELQRYRPFTSADLDLHRPDLSARRLLRARAGNVEPERDPFGKAFTIVSHTFLTDLRRSRHPKLLGFVARRLPGWQQSLGARGIS